MTRSGSIALYVAPVAVLVTSPSLVQEPWAPVVLLAKKMAEFWEPNDDAA